MLSWRTARRSSGTAIALVVIFGLLVPTPAQADGTEVIAAAPGAVTPAAQPAQAAAQVVESDVPTTAPDDREPAPEEPASDDHDEAPIVDAAVVAELEATDLEPFALLGVTWASGLGDTTTRVEARWRSSGTWSDWTELHVEPAPSEEGRPGTEPQWVGEADGAQVRVIAPADSAPRDVALSTIDPGAPDTSTADVASSDVTPAIAMTQSNEVTQAATVGQPSIILRSAWGATSSNSSTSAAISESGHVSVSLVW